MATGDFPERYIQCKRHCKCNAGTLLRDETFGPYEEKLNARIEIQKAIESLKLKFTSANNIQIERATILRSEYEAIIKFYNANVSGNRKPVS